MGPRWLGPKLLEPKWLELEWLELEWFLVRMLERLVVELVTWWGVLGETLVVWESWSRESHKGHPRSGPINRQSLGFHQTSSCRRGEKQLGTVGT